ncbi:clathrin associated protein complex large subunit, partial [Nowakowskiella sp. JEL0078]
MDFGDININKFVSKFSIIRLKDLIKQIRSCKTAAEERAVISKESAFIRTSFKDENNETRSINVAKLLYIHMLGYPAHFGQMECLKLVASPKFTDKRLGYLGIMLLLDENQEVLTLVTNCIKNDLNSTNMYICGLALCTLGNISSQEMARDLSGEIERLLVSSNSYIRKKAALCTLRIIKKVPELMENFVTRAKNLLNERNHGVLLTGITLLTEMCRVNPEVTTEIRKQAVPTLVRHLKNLVTAGFSPEHDVSGITDPFLQVKTLRLMRLLGKGDSEASDAMNDVLAQVATNTESSKNVGNAILYETVLTIMDVESENSLRVLGINILGRFLANRDNNIRYVALTTLTRTAQASSADSSALQRHRSTILDCLRDPDISIRRRALDLSFFLITPQNIRILTRELLSFLEVAESDIKASTASRIVEYAGRYRPNKRWEVDTVVRVLRVSGSFVDQVVINTFVKLVTTADTGLQQYTVRKLYGVVVADGEKAHIQEGLLQAMMWCVGEFGDLLVDGKKTIVLEPEEEEKDSGEFGGCNENEVIDLFELILKGPFATSCVQEYAITALVKLTGKFIQTEVVLKAKKIVHKYKTNIDVEIQQRAVEYSQLFELDYDTRSALLERMPVLESALKEESQKDIFAASAASGVTISEVSSDLLGGSSKPDDIYSMVFGNEKNTSIAKSDKNIMDLLGDIGIGAPALKSTTSPTAAPQTTTDLLGDLFGPGPSSISPQPSQQARPIQTSNFSALDDLLGTTTTPQKPAAIEQTAYEKHGLKITLAATRDTGDTMNVATMFRNVGNGSISGVSMQVAVPKSLKLLLQPPSSTVIPQGGSATQLFRIENPSKVVVRLRLKISFVTGMEQSVDEIVEFSQFNPSL